MSCSRSRQRTRRGDEARHEGNRAARPPPLAKLGHTVFMTAIDDSGAVTYLRTPLAIRARAENILEAGLAGDLEHFAIELDAVEGVARAVVDTTRAAYPDLRIPVHGRTNHFRAAGVDRVAALDAALHGLSSQEQARAWVDLITVSVLLDAGAGDAWAFTEPGSGEVVRRSEGLAVASLHAFQRGVFSSDPAQPLRADRQGLAQLTRERLMDVFQVSERNPLAGLDGRLGLVRDLGSALAAAPDLFPGGRPGGLVDSLHAVAQGGVLPAAEILKAVLEGLGSIWPGRLALGGVNLGDVWRHPAAGGAGPSAGMVPFHKLSQWLTYSLFEPLERSGLQISHAGALTGLPEYRNGGLLVDLGVLRPKHQAVLERVHSPGDVLIVEWRALTVALLDRVADRVRELLGKTPEELPLACILEGGTWATGRAVAHRLRAGGGPPIRIHSDGTVF
jgi:Protein of unknown function (DUF1688)